MAHSVYSEDIFLAQLNNKIKTFWKYDYLLDQLFVEELLWREQKHHHIWHGGCFLSVWYFCLMGSWVSDLDPLLSTCSPFCNRTRGGMGKSYWKDTLLRDAEMCRWCYHEARLGNNRIHRNDHKVWCMILYGLILLTLLYIILYIILLYIMNSIYSISITISYIIILLFPFLLCFSCANKIHFIIKSESVN